MAERPMSQCQSGGHRDDDRLLLPIREAARILSVSERTLYAMTAPRGPIRPVRIGTRVLYSRETLRQWIVDQSDHRE
jgi:excisionase family DNA binding protein